MIGMGLSSIGGFALIELALDNNRGLRQFAASVEEARAGYAGAQSALFPRSASIPTPDAASCRRWYARREAGTARAAPPIPSRRQPDYLLRTGSVRPHTKPEAPPVRVSRLPRRTIRRPAALIGGRQHLVESQGQPEPAGSLPDHLRNPEQLRAVVAQELQPGLQRADRCASGRCANQYRGRADQHLSHAGGRIRSCCWSRRQRCPAASCPVGYWESPWPRLMCGWAAFVTPGAPARRPCVRSLAASSQCGHRRCTQRLLPDLFPDLGTGWPERRFFPLAQCPGAVLVDRPGRLDDPISWGARR